MFITLQAHQYSQFPELVDHMFRLRKEVFADRLGWSVPVCGDHERDCYDDLFPVYLVWCNNQGTRLYGSMRLMPTTGPTLLYDVFHATLPTDVNLVAPGIWEGTRMCIDETAIAEDFPDLSPADAFSRLLLALCECALHHGIGMMLSNYEPHMRRVYRRAGVAVDELGRAEGYGRLPVCCGAFEVSGAVLNSMRQATGITEPLYVHHPVAGRQMAMAIAA
ncbi:acyl-homoserine-lactone synthase [Rhizobium sp. AAP43]|uniref:acyl-homoserine-lactone synthase n=1 Tax=Rhizobium sp. AAP43 TaxID=1523420 RepID=UPI0006B9F181|nr:acyl-homoserine-lactone synthase [Rhizobium sp. AAP43]KPF41507.1 N-acyl-L-homoserine lactone (AHL) synthase [Rhizobium sp. AAP43]